jgi:opacity protein-like surface antigen
MFLKIMIRINRITLLTIITVLILSNGAFAQYATKKVLKKKQAYTDSLKQVKYDYIFPILGQKVYKVGFDIPYPIGLMGNYIWLDQGVVIDNMQLGLKTDNQDIPLTNVDEFIKFRDNTNTSYSINVRPDIWLFPFLNVYGIFGVGSSTTTVNIAEPFEFSSTVEQGIQTSGFGLMGAFGIGLVWTSVDANWTWNKPELLDQAVLVRGLGIRVGKTFTFNQHPDRNIAVWAGGMRVKMESSTVGQIRLGDALPPEIWDRTDEFVARYEEWYNGLPVVIQDRVDQTPLPEIVDRIDQADGDAIVRCGIDKQVKELWNGVFGAQFQYNKRWMFRTEWGLIGDRKSALASVNHRFLL